MSENHEYKTAKVIVFKLLDKEYTIPVTQVRGIEKIHHITRVPNTALYVKGVINLRGVVTPIIDLRTRFGIEEGKYDDSTRVIIVSCGGSDAGLIVDTANDVLDMEDDQIEPKPAVAGTVENSFIKGVAKLENRLLNIVDLERILGIDKKLDQDGEEIS